MTTPLELLRTIAVALERGYSPAEILDENSPLRDELRRLIASPQGQGSGKAPRIGPIFEAGGNFEGAPEL